MADVDALVAELRAALKNVGDVDYNIGLRSLSVKMRFIKPLADARDGKPIVDGISALPHILDALEAAREEIEALMDCEKVLRNLHDIESYDRIAVESVLRQTDAARGAARAGKETT